LHRFIRMKSIFYMANKGLHFVLALQIINLSFNNLASEEHLYSSTGAELNQIDSAMEFITEHLFGLTNFFPEKHKAHQDNHFVKGNTCSYYCERMLQTAVPNKPHQKNNFPHFVAGSLTDHAREINPPPPKIPLV
jgi:hypothetical protein